MKPRDYCCCAIPMFNAGIYFALVEQFVLGILVGTLALATPSIVGASVPSLARWVLAIICYVGAGVQVFGFIGVAKEKSIMFRRYTTIHILITIAAFAVAAVWIIMSATRHGPAQNACLNNFFTDPTTGTASTSTAGEGNILCNIFTWVTVGVMGGLWIILAIMQFYLYIIISAYGTSQRRDHEKYHSLNQSTSPSNNDIPMTHRDPWDARASLEDEHDHPDGYGHVRTQSEASVSTILGEKQQQPRDFGYSDVAPSVYPPQRQGTYSSHRQQPSDTAYVPHPSNAYTQEPGPTPQFYGNYYTDDPQGVTMPGRSQAHPAEGSFGRKRPRIQQHPLQGTSNEFDQSFFNARR